MTPTENEDDTTFQITQEVYMRVSWTRISINMQCMYASELIHIQGIYDFICSWYCIASHRLYLIVLYWFAVLRYCVLCVVCLGLCVLHCRCISSESRIGSCLNMALVIEETCATRGYVKLIDFWNYPKLGQGLPRHIALYTSPSLELLKPKSH